MKTLLVMMTFLLGTGSHASPASDSAAKVWYAGKAATYKLVKCASGYTLHGSNPTTNGIVQGSPSFRCVKVLTVTPNSCSSWVAYAVDGKVGSNQVCAATPNQDFCYDAASPTPCSAISCPSGYSRNPVNGTDQCLQVLTVSPTI